MEANDTIQITRTTASRPGRFGRIPGHTFEMTEDEFRKLFAATLLCIGDRHNAFLPDHLLAAATDLGEFLANHDSAGDEDLSLIGTFLTVNQVVDLLEDARDPMTASLPSGAQAASERFYDDPATDR